MRYMIEIFDDDEFSSSDNMCISSDDDIGDDGDNQEEHVEAPQRCSGEDELVSNREEETSLVNYGTFALCVFNLSDTIV